MTSPPAWPRPCPKATPWGNGPVPRAAALVGLLLFLSIPAFPKDPARYQRFVSYISGVFYGDNQPRVSFTAGLCLLTVREFLQRQSCYEGPDFDLLRGSCNEALAAMKKAGHLRSPASHEQIRTWAAEQPLVGLIAGKGERQHVGIIYQGSDGQVYFCSNSMGRKKIEPYTNRDYTGVVLLR
mgnify:CR=1 FL=1